MDSPTYTHTSQREISVDNTKTTDVLEITTENKGGTTSIKHRRKKQRNSYNSSSHG